MSRSYEKPAVVADRPILLCLSCGAEGPSRETLELTDKAGREEEWFIRRINGMADAEDGAGVVVNPRRLFAAPIVHIFCPKCRPSSHRHRNFLRMQEDLRAAIEEQFPEERRPSV